MRDAVAYYRKSTKQHQQNSFNVQRESILAFAKANNYRIVEEIEEEISARKTFRAGFARACDLVEEKGLFLLCYKVDRISRRLEDWEQISPILDSIRFVQMGDRAPDSFTIGLLLNLAQNESNMIGQRVKATIANLKAAAGDDFKWGNPDIAGEARLKGLAVRVENAKLFNGRILGIIRDMENAGYTEHMQVAERLNAYGIKTRRGKTWNYRNVQRIRLGN